MSKQIVSLTNKMWNVLSDMHSFEKTEDIINILLENRNVQNINQFLNPIIKNIIPDPFVFLDMQKAVERTVSAIESNEKIVILGDYDVDGVSSTALLVNFLNHLNITNEYCIPNRINDGYGLNIQNIKKYKDCLIIAVDCGSSSNDELEDAKMLGTDVIVIDHHKMNFIPKAFAIVNPHRPDEKPDYRYLCAAGLVFMFLVGINRLLRERGFYSKKIIREPELLDYLDLVALATVCDVMNLVKLNRAFVSTGIKTIQRRKNLGIDALISVSKSSAISSDTIAFFFGPRINAAGRLSSATEAVKLLTTKNPIEARNIALQLDELNSKRKLLELEVIEQALRCIDNELKFICAYDSRWHPGIIGIIAGRLKERYHKPSFIISIDENGVGKASCRSIDAIDIEVIVNKAIQKNIISSGGGHSMAAGFSIKAEKIMDFIDFLKSEIQYNISLPELYADCLFPLQSISVDAIKLISKLEPFGMGNNRPKFVIPNLRIKSCRLIGKNHLQLDLVDNENNSLRGISFKSADTHLGEILMNCDKQISALGSLMISEWKGREQINLHLEDVASVTF